MGSYLQGLLLGLAYVAPIGVQNLFVIHTALTRPRRQVFLTALIVCFFDVTLGWACFFGMGALMQSFPLLEKLILLLGGLLVIAIGAGLIRHRNDPLPREERGESGGFSLTGTVSRACVVTWFNPQALVDGSMLLGAVRASLPVGTELFFAAGFSSASLLWFFGVSALISLFSARFGPGILRVIHSLCGGVIILCGLRLLLLFFRLL